MVTGCVEPSVPVAGDGLGDGIGVGVGDSSGETDGVAATADGAAPIDSDEAAPLGMDEAAKLGGAFTAEMVAVGWAIGRDDVSTALPDANTAAIAASVMTR